MNISDYLASWWTIVFLSAIGLVDTAYLSYARLTHAGLECSILEGCDIVAISPLSLLFGIVPLSYLGFIFYGGVMFCGLWYIYTRREAARYALTAMGALGFISSMYFLYIQAFVIKAYCVYCILSATLATIIFGLLIYRHHRIVRARTTSSVGI